MSPPLLHNLISASLPDHCVPTSPFLTAVSSHLHICIPTPLAAISSVLGTLSIVSWLFAQLPQIFKNFQLQSTSGLSIFFLIIWCLGDASNLVGALFTRQAGWQVVVAGYYVLVDITMVFQFFWYTHLKDRRSGDYDELSHSFDSDGREIIQGVSPPGHEGSHHTQAAVDMNTKAAEAKSMGIQTGSTPRSTDQTASYSNEKLSSSRRSVRVGSSAQSAPFALPRTMLIASLLCAMIANAAPTESPHPPISHAPSETILEIVGRVISWMSTFLYLGSRPPQLYKNYQRKSTEGLSPLLFMAAFCGNLFYSTSLLTNRMPGRISRHMAAAAGPMITAMTAGNGSDVRSRSSLARSVFLGWMGSWVFSSSCTAMARMLRMMAVSLVPRAVIRSVGGAAGNACVVGCVAGFRLLHQSGSREIFRDRRRGRLCLARSVADMARFNDVHS